MAYCKGLPQEAKTRLCAALLWFLLAGCGQDAPAQFTGTGADDVETQAAKVKSSESRPNILLIVADDLGYADLARYGGEIRTPNIDDLAASGQTFSQFYAAATCSPSRSMLLTGVDNHLAGLGNMGENMAPNQRGQAGYEGLLNNQVVTLPTRLRKAGYHTSMAGKWHLGAQPGSRPHERGFDHSFALIQGGASHFADQKRILSLYPESVYLDNGVKVTSLPKDFYSSKDFADQTIGYLQHSLQERKPFFAFLSFTAPHWPLQVPDQHIDLYAGQYDDGYDALRVRRLNKMNQLGLLPAGVENTQRVPLARPWNTLAEDAQTRQSKTMEVYAAMVETMDHHIGRVLDQLRADGRYHNTLVVFLSDNGAEGNDRMRLADNATWVPANFDLSLSNIGKVNSYTMQHAGWGQASSVPFRFFKGYSTEGGLRAPLIIAGPSVPAKANYVRAVATIRDLAPTMLEFAGLSANDNIRSFPNVHPIEGRSLRPLLSGETNQVYTAEDALGWEMFGHRAIRKGDWKILWADGRNGADGWQLFNIADDPRETDDLSLRNPAKFDELIEDWDRYVERNNVILPDNTDGLF